MLLPGIGVESRFKDWTLALGVRYEGSHTQGYYQNVTYCDYNYYCSTQPVYRERTIIDGALYGGVAYTPLHIGPLAGVNLHLGAFVGLDSGFQSNNPMRPFIGGGFAAIEGRNFGVNLLLTPPIPPPKDDPSREGAPFSIGIQLKFGGPTYIHRHGASAPPPQP